MKRVIRQHVLLHEDQARRLRAAAQASGVSEAEYLRQALDTAFKESDRLASTAARAWRREDCYDRPYPGRFAR
jgi:hypothetical protein